MVTVAFYCLQFEYRFPLVVSYNVYTIYMCVRNSQGIYIKRSTLYYYIARLFRPTSANLHATSVRPICSIYMAHSFICLIHIVKAYTKLNNKAHTHTDIRVCIRDDILVFYLTFILQGGVQIINHKIYYLDSASSSLTKLQNYF